jgi:hypothetical protein
MKKSGKKMIMAGIVTAGNGGVSHRWYWLAFSPALIEMQDKILSGSKWA